MNWEDEYMVVVRERDAARDFVRTFAPILITEGKCTINDVRRAINLPPASDAAMVLVGTIEADEA